MEKITATELARNLRAVLDRVVETRQVYEVERGRRVVAQIQPSPGHLTAEQALADLYRTLDDRAGASWLDDARKAANHLDEGLRDPWDF